MAVLSVSIVKLENPIQHYAWGSHTSIAALQGRAGPTAQPEAELWIGDHPVAPSRVKGAVEGIPLPEWVSLDPERWLGVGRARLPFLAKVLAAERALSLQVHPDEHQARAGFAREVAAAVPETERCYRDPSEKHELLVALSRFEALCGFRSDAEVSAWLAAEPRLAQCLDSGSLEQPLAMALLLRLQTLSMAERRELCLELEVSVAAAAGVEADWTRRLLREHPGDPLALVPALLHPIVLDPGQALVVSPGVVHSYLSGMGVEVMTPSDNVVRAGLTHKHVNAEELARIASPRASSPEIVRPQVLSGDLREARYATQTDAFEVRVLELEGERSVVRSGGRVAVLLCVEGALEADGVELSAGEAALVPAALERYELKGSAGRSRVFEVSSG